MVKWPQVLEEVKTALAEFSSYNTKPTLRALFYWLVSKQIIPNTKGIYNTLSHQFALARKAGLFPFDCITDETRITLGELRHRKYDPNKVEYIEERCKEKVDNLSVDNLLEEYFSDVHPDSYDFNVEKWSQQPIIPEIWIEKSSLASVIHNWVKEWGIPVKPNKGYSSWTFIHKNVEELKANLRYHTSIKIFYMGDLDPSGCDAERHLKDALTFFEIDPERVSISRLALTPHQVEEYKLPPRPEDAATLAKLERDPRNAKYDIPYVVELDALLAFNPGEFKRLILDSLSACWDEEIYNQQTTQAEEDYRKAKLIVEEAIEAAAQVLGGSGQ